MTAKEWGTHDAVWCSQRVHIMLNDLIAAEARCAKLEEALKPFAQMMLPKSRDGEHVTTCMSVDCFRAARAALATVKEDVAFPCCGGVDAHRVSCHRATAKED